MVPLLLLMKKELSMVPVYGGPDKVLSFKIISGTKNFLFAKGYVVIVTDKNNGRQLQFYFAK